MRNATIWAMGLTALVGLTACDKGADTNGDGKISDSEVAVEMGTVKLEPGQWEATVTVLDASATNMPPNAPPGVMDKIKGRKTSSKSCISKEQAENPGAQFFAAQQNVKCDVRKFSMSGGKIASDMTCSPEGMPGSMVITMNGDYGASSYNMEMTTDTSGLPDGMAIKMKAKAVGKRIGDCPA